MLLLAAALACAALLPASAPGSQLIDRNASGVKLAVDARGRALLTYRIGGAQRRVLAWDAINAITPTRSRPQVRFKLEYSGPRGAFRDACRAYDGPALHWLVTACKGPDGSYWAVQRWQRALPNYGLAPTAAQRAWELRLSHWRGELPVLEINLDWAYRGRFDHLYGRLHYAGKPVHGFRATPAGVPLDSFGRNVYVDTLDSAYGAGWQRENSFLTHRGSGTFCYGFFPHGARPAGKGTAYRATVIGPGVTPDPYWEGTAPGPYDPTHDGAANDEQRVLFRDSSLCRAN